MPRSSLVPTSCASVAALALTFGAPQDLSAQARDDLIRQASRAYEEFETGRAVDLLKAALDPTTGPTDSLWAHGVHLLAQIYLEQGETGLATAWLRWAMRLAPTTPVDRVTFLPEVLAVSDSARAVARRGGAGEQVTQTRWEWVRGAPAGLQGNIRVEAGAGVTAQLRVLVAGRVVRAGQTVLLAPGSYDVQAAADGYLGSQVSREVLPGITTVLTFNLAPVAAAAPVAANVLTEDARAAVGRQIAPLTVRRHGVEPACAMAAFVGGQGLLLTTYRAIRGAETVEVVLAGGRRLSDEVRVVAYDVPNDVAVLYVSVVRTDSLVLGSAAAAEQAAWAFSLRQCSAPTDSRVEIARVAGATAELRGGAAEAVVGGPLVSASGAVVGVVSAAGSAVPVQVLAPLIQNARTSTQRQTVAQVALRENHAYGSIALTADVTGATARITPLERWHWPEAARSGGLPLTFAGPMGRYQLAVEATGQPTRQQEFTIQASSAQRLAVTLRPVAAAPAPQVQVPPPRRGGGFPVPLAIGGAAGLGALAFLLLAGGGDDGGNGPGPGPGSTGGIRISIPNP